MQKNNRFLMVLNKFKGNEYNSRFPLYPSDLHNLFVLFQKSQKHKWPEELNYYCNIQVAKNIIGKGTLWLNDVRKMNDKTEMTFAIEHFNHKISHFKSVNGTNQNLIQVIEESFLQLADSSIWKDTITYNDKLILAMCFTEGKDDASMWDRYGDSGEGVSIHFNFKKLSTTITTAGIFVPNSSTFENGIVKVCYSGEKCNCLEDLIHDVFEAYKQTKNNDERDLIRTMLHANVLELLMSHKHYSFSSEKEFRIYSKAPSVKTWWGSDHIFEHGEGNRKSLHSVIFLPHHAINQSEEEFWKDLISGVTIGPCASQATKDEIQLALESRGLGDRLRSSQCPLRK